MSAILKKKFKVILEIEAETDNSFIKERGLDKLVETIFKGFSHVTLGTSLLVTDFKLEEIHPANG